jgi:lipoyl(octanoyl) transferase
MIRFIDWGVIDYKEAWDRQTEIFTDLILAKKETAYLNIAAQWQQVIFCEHPHVYTLGAHGDSSNMLIQDERLKSLGASFYKTDRGGDITYHGYGQIVVYPIIDLEVLHLSLKQYVHYLEEAVIQTLLRYGLKAERAKGATGVWFDYETPSARKICAVGVRASHFVTMHGIAFNVATDLAYFSYINPCGFIDKGVTSLEKELGSPVDIEEVKTILKEELGKLLQA